MLSNECILNNKISGIKLVFSLYATIKMMHGPINIRYLIIFLDFLSPSSFIPPQNILYFLMLHFLVHKIFTFYINGVLNCKCPAPGPKG